MPNAQIVPSAPAVSCANESPEGSEGTGDCNPLPLTTVTSVPTPPLVVIHASVDESAAIDMMRRMGIDNH